MAEDPAAEIEAGRVTDEKQGDLTAEQIAQLDAALDALAESRSYRPTLNGLIRGWRELVQQMEAGCDWSIYEYFDDLHVRAMLQSVVDGAPAIRSWVEAEIAPLDDRFRAATRPRETDELLDRVPRFPGPALAGDLDDPAATTTLYRPVGDDELALIEEAGFARFPERLQEQPIFYPVLSEAYAERIAREWNARDGRRGHVTRFAVYADFLRRYPAHAVGGEDLRELWVPADELDEFCTHIVGPIEVVSTFPVERK